MNYGKIGRIVSGYLDCALWTGVSDDCEPLDRLFGVSDFAPDAILTAWNDCAAFLARCEAAGVADFDALILRPCGDPDGSAGQDFSLTRNGHGAGFWDGDWGEGDKLTTASDAAGEAFLYVGDDGQLHFD